MIFFFLNSVIFKNNQKNAHIIMRSFTLKTVWRVNSEINTALGRCQDLRVEKIENWPWMTGFPFRLELRTFLDSVTRVLISEFVLTGSLFVMAACSSSAWISVACATAAKWRSTEAKKRCFGKEHHFKTEVRLNWPFEKPHNNLASSGKDWRFFDCH